MSKTIDNRIKALEVRIKKHEQEGKKKDREAIQYWKNAIKSAETNKKKAKSQDVKEKFHAKLRNQRESLEKATKRQSSRNKTITELKSRKLQLLKK